MVTTIATLHRISAERLSSILLGPEDASKVAIVDVRDDDHIGGHIHSSINVPSASLDQRWPEVTKDLADKDIVIFHCYLSQQRGPSAALRYLRERDAILKKKHVLDSKDEKDKKSITENKELEQADQGKEVEVSNAEPKAETRKKQEVYVLDGGFVKWQEKCVSSLSLPFPEHWNRSCYRHRHG